MSAAQENLASQHRLKVFISSSKDDEPLRKAFEKHLALLKREGEIHTWHDRHIEPGEARQAEIDTQLESADLILLLISPDFIASDYCYGSEMERALERHDGGMARVVPIILRPTDWQTAAFAHLQPLPKDGQPVTSWSNQDEALVSIVQGLRKVIETLRPVAPDYPDPETRDRSLALERAYEHRAELEAEGENTRAIDKTIVGLKRELREGGHLKAGDLLLEGRFRLQQLIGRGGFAQVWKAYDLERRAIVAIKVLHSQYGQDKSRQDRFFRGARQMARLRDHPGVVSVLEESCHDGGYHFYVMEYVGGGDLRQAVLGGRLSAEERLAVIAEVGETLRCAHERGIIHRDVKPANVLLDLDGRPKLTDFDLVRAADTTGGTRTSMLGTFLYAAPEAMVDGKTAAEPADVYGLGMTAVFAFYGADLPPDVMWELPDFVAELEVSEGCRRALQLAVARKLEDRWGSVAEFCQALSKADDIPTEIEASTDVSKPATRSKKKSRPSRKRKPKPRPRVVPAGDDLELFRGVETSRDGRVELWREIPAGECWIGSPKSEEGRRDNEGPRHKVRIVQPFEMMAAPVTNAQYAVFRSDRADAERPDHPVVNVAWDEARSFCEWLGKNVPGCANVRLPTEEEWEYACRAGTETRYWNGDSVEALAEVGWYRENSDHRLHPVGEKRANEWGLYDIHGNVWEWTASRWKADYSGQEAGLTVDPAVEPADLAGATPGGGRVIRGGSFGVDATRARSAFRFLRLSRSRDRDLGFRLVRPVGRPEP